VRDATRGSRGAWRARWAVRLGGLALRLLARTWRLRIVGREHLLAARADPRGRMYLCWHGQMLPLLWQHRREGVAIVISEHRDGELIARAAESFGFRTIRGSTSRGGERALLAMIRELERGGEVAVTPDGPRGPAGSFAPGALVAAHRAGALVVALGARADRAWRLRSWDRFLIPKPFARVTIAYCAPTELAASTPRAAADAGPRFRDMMQAVAPVSDGVDG
jgi:lysophospholipid acyltransferase (LPLAT)-like uncharacterized protein